MYSTVKWDVVVYSGFGAIRMQRNAECHCIGQKGTDLLDEVKKNARHGLGIVDRNILSFLYAYSVVRDSISYLSMFK